MWLRNIYLWLLGDLRMNRHINVEQYYTKYPIGVAIAMLYIAIAWSPAPTQLFDVARWSWVWARDEASAYHISQKSPTRSALASTISYTSLSRPQAAPSFQRFKAGSGQGTRLQ